MNKNLLLLFFSVFYAINSFGQITFQENFIFNDREFVNNSKSVFAVDFDGDGDLDVLAGSEDKIVWFENIDGKGDFRVKQVISTEQRRIENIYAADLDGDGDMDVISSVKNSASDTNVWYENTNGLGDFGERQVLPDSYFLRTTLVHASDIDGDGDMDVLCASYVDGDIAWYENTDGLGNFANYTILTRDTNGNTSSSLSSFNTFDLDGDGDLDIISAHLGTDKIVWYENTDGLGTFGLQQIISTEADGPQSVYAMDLDGDGDLDVLSASLYDNKISWYENLDSNGAFGSQQVITTDANFAKSVYSSDFDGDGDSDVISASANDNKIAWYENLDGMGSFGGQQIITTNANFASSVYSGDFNGDGDIDVLSASKNDDKVAWYKNLDGQGNFSIPQIISAIVYKLTSTHASDVDGDGDLDVLSASRGDGKIAWYENSDGKGSFDLGMQRVITANSAEFYSVYSADIDGDGDMDVLSASLKSDFIAWYENTDGLGDFGEQQLITTVADGAIMVCAIDVDGDGDIDVVSASSNDNKIAWYENRDGFGSFGNQQIITTNANFATSVYSNDLDGDGDMDIMSASFNDSKIAWYENTDGQGNFGSQQIITTDVVGANSVYSADIDGDGDMDILSASYGEGKIDWYENINGLGDFSTRKEISQNVTLANNVSAKDIDNDGDIDVISGNPWGASWFENIDGQGSFGIKQDMSVTYHGSLQSLNVIDIDSDGDLDVLTSFMITNTDTPKDKIIWYENLGQVTNEIWGTVQIDTDMNGCSLEDIFAPNLLVTTTDGQNSLSSFTLPNGIYQLFPLEGDFTTEITSEFPDYYNLSPSSDSSSFTSVGNTDMSDFCIEPNQTINDLKISLYPNIDDPRLGFDTSYRIVYNNIGTTQISGDISFEFDESKIQFLSSSEAVASQTSNTLTFGYTDLNPFETRTIDLKLNVFPPPTTNIDDVLITTVIVNPVAEDNTSEDNVFTLDQTVIGSYDPNDIRVLEGEQITVEEVDNYLHYIIRFQNTGTASAIDVNVENALDNQLDWTTMQLESLSHTGRVEITNGNMVKFIFDNINLPDTTSDEPNSHGFIAYKIKPKSGITIGDIMPNQADIFFDFNPAITTNMVTTEITSSLNVDESLTSKFHIYPNPIKAVLNIQSKTQIIKLEIYNNIGQVVSSELNKTTIDLSRLTAGLYFIKIKDTLGNSEIKKIIKE